MLRALHAAPIAALLLVAAPVLADNAPSAAQLRTAAEQFDLGVEAYKQRAYEQAASHFEAADSAVPSAKTLRLSIRARVEAGQASRAATLAALARLRYPGDEATGKIARETLDKLAPRLHEVHVTCGSPCVLAVGARVVPGEPRDRWVVFLDPGKAEVRASFSDTVAAAPRSLVAKAGGMDELSFEPEEEPGPVAPPKKDTPLKKDAPEEPKPKGISPAFFGVSLAVTAGLGATTIWSGVDTLTNPGVDAVKAACQGKGEGCPLYQEGLSKQRRTNVLIGATAGVAAVTVVFAVFTRWRGAKKKPVEPLAAVVDGGGALLGARGVF